MAAYEQPDNCIVGVCTGLDGLQRGSSPPFPLSTVPWDSRQGGRPLQLRKRSNRDVKCFTQGHVIGRLAPSLHPDSQPAAFPTGVSQWHASGTWDWTIRWALQDIYNPGRWGLKCRGDFLNASRARKAPHLSHSGEPVLDRGLSGFRVHPPAQPVSQGSQRHRGWACHV